MDVQQLYDLISAHLDNEKSSPLEKMGKCKRMRLPIPEEYGGGIVTGYGYADTIRNLVDRIKEKIKMESNSPLFKDCFEKWIKIKEGQNKSPSTIASYRFVATTHILPLLGEKPIDTITPDDIQECFNGIINKSKSLNNQVKAVLSGVFNRAVRMKEVDQNIMLYQYERSKKVGKKIVLQDSDLISVIQQIDLLKNTGDIRDYIYFCCLCFTALRRGEILGLRWQDISFEKQEINVQNNVSFPNGTFTPYITQPKDGSSGTVHLNSELMRRIEPYKQRSGYLLPYSSDQKHKPMTRSMFDKMWRRIKTTIDLKGATSHSFRSSYATMMNAHCDHIDPKALQGALRHRTPDLAIKVYTKENTNKTRIAEEEYDAWLCGELEKCIIK